MCLYNLIIPLSWIVGGSGGGADRPDDNGLF